VLRGLARLLCLPRRLLGALGAAGGSGSIPAWLGSVQIIHASRFLFILNVAKSAFRACFRIPGSLSRDAGGLEPRANVLFPGKRSRGSESGPSPRAAGAAPSVRRAPPRSRAAQVSPRCRHRPRGWAIAAPERFAPGRGAGGFEILWGEKAGALRSAVRWGLTGEGARLGVGAGFGDGWCRLVVGVPAVPEPWVLPWGASVPLNFQPWIWAAAGADGGRARPSGRGTEGRTPALGGDARLCSLQGRSLPATAGISSAPRCCRYERSGNCPGAGNAPGVAGFSRRFKNQWFKIVGGGQELSPALGLAGSTEQGCWRGQVPGACWVGGEVGRVPGGAGDPAMSASCLAWHCILVSLPSLAVMRWFLVRGGRGTSPGSVPWW